MRDGISLIAFLSLVLLLAFRTKKVPDLFFGLVRDKLTRKEFAILLRRFMILGFIAFLVLVAMAIVAQVLAARTHPEALTIGDLRQELARISESTEEKIRAEAKFNLALAQLGQQDLEGAIAALQQSVDAVPTLTAQEMLTYLHRRQGDLEKASESWAQAMSKAREKGDWVAQARLDRAGAPPRGIPDPSGDTDLVGESRPLPRAGERFETATRLRPGFYHCEVEGGCLGWWYGLPLESGERLSVRFRSPVEGGKCGLLLYGTNGEALLQVGDGIHTMRGNAGPAATVRELRWVARVTGNHFLLVISNPGSVWRIRVG